MLFTADSTVADAINEARETGESLEEVLIRAADALAE